jgi:outer membrane protein assembly factor BamB
MRMPAMNLASRKAQFCLTLVSVLTLSGLCFAQPAVTLSVTTGPPTTNVLVSGSGFPANTAVEIYFDLTELAEVVTNSAGSFSKFKIQVPASAPPGTNWITAEVSATDEAAQAPFNVRTNWPEFHYANNRSGLNPYENVLSPSTVGNLGLLWSHLNTGATDAGKGVYSSPAVVNGVVYVSSFDDNVYTLNAKTGAKMWQFTAGAGVFSSPAVSNGVVYFGSYDDNVYALKSTTGAELWHFGTTNYVKSSPAVVDGVVYIGSFDDAIFALTAGPDSSADIVWDFSSGGSVESSPAVANGLVYVGSDSNYLYALEASGPGAGNVVWKFGPLTNTVTSTPAVVDGVVYVGSWDDNVYALNAKFGTEMWKFTTGNYITSSPAVANGVVYIGSGDSNVYAINAYTGAELWQFTTGGPVDSSPAVANGVVYVGSGDGNFYALDAAYGYELWQYTTGGEVYSPAVANGVVYVGSTDSHVYAFGLTNAPVAAPERPDPAILRPSLSMNK